MTAATTAHSAPQRTCYTWPLKLIQDSIEKCAVVRSVRCGLDGDGSRRATVAMSGSMLLCYENFMSEITTQADRDGKTGRFLPGNSGLGGRPKGSRNRHSEFFLASFAADFEQHGPAVIALVREQQPATYLRIAADLLPKEATLDIDINVLGDVTNVVQAFRIAADLLGADPAAGMRRLRKVAPQLEQYDAAAE